MKKLIFIGLLFLFSCQKETCYIPVPEPEYGIPDLTIKYDAMYKHIMYVYWCYNDSVYISIELEQKGPCEQWTKREVIGSCSADSCLNR